PGERLRARRTRQRAHDAALAPLVHEPRLRMLLHAARLECRHVVLEPFRREPPDDVFPLRHLALLLLQEPANRPPRPRGPWQRRGPPLAGEQSPVGRTGLRLVLNYTAARTRRASPALRARGRQRRALPRRGARARVLRSRAAWPRGRAGSRGTRARPRAGACPRGPSARRGTGWNRWRAAARAARRARSSPRRGASPDGR